jgi:hypothetical protein
MQGFSWSHMGWVGIPWSNGHSHWRVAHRRAHHHWVPHVVRWRVVTTGRASGAGVHHVRRRHTPRSRRRNRNTACRWRCRSLRSRRSSFPGLVRHSHGKVGSSLILDLSPFIDQCLRTGIIQTIRTLAFPSANNSCLETLKDTIRYTLLAKHMHARDWTRQFFLHDGCLPRNTS